MTPFLKQVAQHYFRESDIQTLCFVFPNRRSLAFFKKYLSEEVAAAGKACLCPQLFTVNDFFYGIAGKTPTSNIRLLVSLYECYKTLVPRPEPLDDFIFWGNVILSDFNDIDKYLVDASMLFTNVADFRKMQDSRDYLSKTQIEALEKFLGNFSTPGEFKDRFWGIWSVLGTLYRNFNEYLSANGCCYEGQVYREVAARLSGKPVVDVLPGGLREVGKFVFVGLNALNECEKKLLGKLRDAGLAEFCWDFSSTFIKDPHNKSSLFLTANVQAFPQAFKIDPEGLELPDFKVMSVPSSIGQAKQIPGILSRIPAVGINTAIVLPDEELLIPVLNSIPADIDKLNVTMGYPLGGSELWALMDQVAQLQAHIREKDGRKFFYHKNVWAIFSNSIFKTVASGEDAAAVEAVRKSARYYIPQEELCAGELMRLIFRPAGEKVAEYLLPLVSYLAGALKNVPDMEVELDFAREYYLSVGQLSSCEGFEVSGDTYFRVLGSMVRSGSVPFRGEPLEGLQIMGPLETRALDFENVIVLSCNEGMFPRHNVSASFVPAELRKGFDLPTYEYQDSVWAYYFYRMIQRASNVWLLYDSRTEISRSGEPSRYISQLEMHFGVKPEQYVISAPISSPSEPEELVKTPEMVEALHRGHLSVSAVQTYMECPAKFYFSKVCGLRVDDEVAEALDASGKGTVFHGVMQDIYGAAPGGVVSRKYISSVLKDREGICSRVRTLMLKELRSFDISGRNVIYEDLICRFVANTLERDLELLETKGVDSFKVLGLEIRRFGRIHGFDFVGIADRIDSFADGQARIVDYKTGHVDKDKVDLQLFVYDSIMSSDEILRGRKMIFSTYDVHRLFVDPVEEREFTDEERKVMSGVLKDTLSEIENTDVPFERRGQNKTYGKSCACDKCDFRQICGK